MLFAPNVHKSRTNPRVGYDKVGLRIRRVRGESGWEGIWKFFCLVTFKKNSSGSVRDKKKFTISGQPFCGFGSRNVVGGKF